MATRTIATAFAVALTTTAAQAQYYPYAQQPAAPQGTLAPLPYSQVAPWLPPAYPPGTTPGTMISPPPTYVVPPAPAPTQIWPQPMYRQP